MKEVGLNPAGVWIFVMGGAVGHYFSYPFNADFGFVALFAFWFFHSRNVSASHVPIRPPAIILMPKLTRCAVNPI